MAELNFIILKINGSDVSRLTQNEAVQMFLSAPDPIVIEIRRKGGATAAASTIKRTKKPSAEMPPDDSLLAKLNHLKLLPDAEQVTPVTPNESAAIDNCSNNRKVAPPLHPVESKLLLTLSQEQATHNRDGQQATAVGIAAVAHKYVSSATQTDNRLFSLNSVETETANRSIEQEHNIFEQCLAPEIDIEEITLRKSDSNERLGLTVCYSGCSNSTGNNNNGALSGSVGDENEICTEVFISDIQPDSIAYRDGRLRQGDQILQINGKDLKNKDETELLIAENNNAVTLLVSRYLYTDDDDFNDPFITDLDIEENDDDDDDEEEEEYYDENNLAYENCFIANSYMNAVDDLDKALRSQGTSLNETEKLLRVMPPTGVATKTRSSAIGVEDTKAAPAALDPLDAHVLEPKAPTKTEGEHNAKNDGIAEFKGEQRDSKVKACKNLHNDYETEHIYETIPEDSESEPLYCSPYESSMYVTAAGSCSSNTTDAFQSNQQKQRVAQWLGLKEQANTTGALAATIPSRHHVRSNGANEQAATNIPNYLYARNKMDTVYSAATLATHSSMGIGSLAGNCGTNAAAQSQNDEQDNSSSAYNTGGSNNSASPLTLILNQYIRDDELTCNVNIEPDELKSRRIQSPRDKITSPKNNTVTSSKGLDGGGTANMHRSCNGPLSNESQQQFSQKTLYTNEANLHQTMLLQQRLLRQALCSQQQLQQDQHSINQCPQFTAPNLSQYHFVSSQEVCASHTSTKPAAVVVAHKNASDEAMVWKVKRRQDGSRYIVRRPARNRLIRDRSLRLNTERMRNDNTTTEEDTISEVKTGRYWSKEDRKKHIERARERRQQQHHQQQHQQQHIETSASNNGLATMRLSNKATLKLQQRDRLTQNNTNSICNSSSSNIKQATKPNSIRPPVQQHYQLQFNTCAAHQFLPALVNGPNNGAVIDNAATTTTTAAAAAAINPVALSSKSMLLSTNFHISSPVNTMSKLNATLAPAAPAAAVGAVDGLLEAAAGFPSTADTSKSNNFLSVTTV